MPFIDVRTGNARQGCLLLMSEQGMLAGMPFIDVIT